MYILLQKTSFRTFSSVFVLSDLIEYNYVS